MALTQAAGLNVSIAPLRTANELAFGAY